MEERLRLARAEAGGRVAVPTARPRGRGEMPVGGDPVGGDPAAAAVVGDSDSLEGALPAAAAQGANAPPDAGAEPGRQFRVHCLG